MKRPSPFDRRGQSATLDSAMTPMIDVVFLLLVFFVWTASFQMVEQLLPSEMSSQMGDSNTPIDEPPPEEDFERVVIRIGWNGNSPTWKINETTVDSFADIQEHLTRLVQIKADAPLVLHPDPAVPLGFVISAYDAAKIVGFNQVSFAVNPSR